MKQSINYTTILPNFIEMQRVSFCWFISYGLSEELGMFSSVYDFTYNIEYVLFGHEYSLVKPIYNFTRAKKYTANYSAQLLIPLEIRNKKTNTVCHHSQFPIINLPLMTTFATFIVNGCERVIVSQIIRSPGIYFEKNKNQKKRKLIKRKISSNTTRLKDFIPLGEPFISEQKLSFFPNTFNQNLFNYSFLELQKTEKIISFKFLEAFKIYQIILKTTQIDKKLERIKVFLHWLVMKEKQLVQLNSSKQFKDINQLRTWNFLLKLLIKYQLINQVSIASTKPMELQWQYKIFNSFQCLDKGLDTNDNVPTIVNYYKKITQCKLENNMLLMLVAVQNSLNSINQFKYLIHHSFINKSIQ